MQSETTKETITRNLKYKLACYKKKKTLVLSVLSYAPQNDEKQLLTHN